MLLNYLVGLATYKSKQLEALVEGRPEVLIHNGKLFTGVMEREKLTHHELNAALRDAGCAGVEEVHYAIIENDGQISVQPKNPGRRTPVPPQSLISGWERGNNSKWLRRHLLECRERTINLANAFRHIHITV